MNKIEGIVVPLVTPLTGEDKIDVKGTENLVNRVIAGGVHALFLLGTTGEAQSLSMACRREFVELVAKVNAGRLPIFVCITDTSIADSIALAHYAKECGATAVVSAPPYYFASSQSELVDYYTSLADRVPLPLYLYNMPSHVKVSFEPQTVETLSKHPNIVVLKDSSANMTYLQTLGYVTREQDF